MQPFSIKKPYWRGFLPGMSGAFENVDPRPDGEYRLVLIHDDASVTSGCGSAWVGMRAPEGKAGLSRRSRGQRRRCRGRLWHFEAGSPGR